MKKILLMIGAVASISLSVTGQTRMTLHEEFTGENCPPCASTNPGFWTLCDAGTNPTKLIHISYMVPIPSAGWYCDRTSAIYTARDAYYSVPFAPYGRYDGHVPNAATSSPGHPGYFTQADIDSEAAVVSPFNMTMTNSWNATFDSVTTTINVTCVAAYSGTLFLRTALIQTNDFTTSPGTNGETHFANVVQAMYPSAAGTSIAGTWTVGMTSSYTIKGACPTWVDKTNAPYMVAWIQNDADKRIAQAAKATALPVITLDAGTTASNVTSRLVCATGTYSVAHTMTLKNSGTTTLTSATIYYKVDAGTYTAFPWTGSLAAGATASVTMPATTVTFTGCGYHFITDSVAKPNGVTDVNLFNNVSSTYVFIENTTGLPLPYSTSFEGTDYLQHYMTDANNDGKTWSVFYNTTTPLGHTGSYAAKYNNYTAATGVANVLTLPVVTTGTRASVDFYVASCQVSGTENDKLDVVYSSNCGSSWTSVWTLSGTALATVPASTYYFTPTAATQYTKRTASLNGLPAGSIIGFQATSGHGQNLWLDDINIRSTVDVKSIGELSGAISIFPNPTKDEATISFNLTDNSDVQVQVIDGLGRVVSTLANGSLEAGAHTYSVNTSAYASGIYNVVIHTDAGVTTERLTVIK